MCLKLYDRILMDVRDFGAVSVLWMLLLAISCSVKEDRDLCPCVLEIDFRSSDSLSFSCVDLMVFSDGDYVWRDAVDLMHDTGVYSLEVPRTDLHISAWVGSGNYLSDKGVLLIPFGEDCPEVYMHGSDICAEGESCRETVFLRKNHCVMTLVTEGEGKISSGLKVKGNVSGYDEYGVPLPGDFEFVLDDEWHEGGYEVVLPRQYDASLILEADDGNGHYKAFSLGHYIVSSGYDWTSPDLDDVTVTLDYALTEVRLVVNGWESVFKYDMEI